MDVEEQETPETPPNPIQVAAALLSPGTERILSQIKSVRAADEEAVHAAAERLSLFKEKKANRRFDPAAASLDHSTSTPHTEQVNHPTEFMLPCTCSMLQFCNLTTVWT